MAQRTTRQRVTAFACSVALVQTVDALSFSIARNRLDASGLHSLGPVIPQQLLIEHITAHHSPVLERHNRTTTSRTLKRLYNNTDSINNFHQDVTTVLRDLRGAPTDHTVPALFRRDHHGGPSFSRTWTLVDWERYSSRRRYVDYIMTFTSSRMLRRLLPQLSVLACWSMMAVWLFSKRSSLLHIPLAPLSLVSTFVAALLALRSNQGLGRLAEGRAAMRSALQNTRHLAQLIAASVYPRNSYLALKMLRHVAVFVWMLKNFNRNNELNAEDSDLLYAMLSPADAAFVMKHRKKPVAIVTRLRQIVASMTDSGQLNTATQLNLDHAVQQLNGCITTCERIRASPIPPLYTAHTGLLLSCYLFFLPLALHGSNLLQPVVTVVTTIVVGYAMLGLDEISHILEQPFKLMPLYQQSKTSMRDVADAIVERPPALMETERQHEATTTTTEKSRAVPDYW